MASTNAIINVIVNGQQRVEQLISRTNQLNDLIDSINRAPIDLTIGTGSANDQNLRQLNSRLEGTRRGIQRTRDAISQGISNMAEYRQAVQSATQELDGLSLGTVRYSRVQRRLTNARQAFDDQSAAVQRLERSLVGLQEREAREFGQVRRAEAFRAQIEFANELADTYLNVETAARRLRGEIGNISRNRSSATLQSEIQFFDQLAANVNLSSEAFRRFTAASGSAGIAAGEASRRRFRILAETFDPSVVVRGNQGQVPSTASRTPAQSQANTEIQNLLDAFPIVARSRAGLEDYRSQLQSVLDLIPAGTARFIQLSNAVRTVDQELSRFGDVNRQLGPQQFIQTAPSGPVSDRLNSLKQQQEYAVRVNNEYRKQTDLADRITASSIGTVEKERLSVQLNRALDDLAEHRLESAEMITREIQRQLGLQEKLYKNKPEQTFGVLGTDFLPISGKMPTGALIPGSPAAKREGTIAAVALGKQKLKALEDEQAELRKGTEAAVALAKQRQKAIDDELAELRKGTQAATSLAKQRQKALQDEADELRKQTEAAVALARQKEKAIQDQADLLRKQTSDAVALAQQAMREQERATADAWKMRGGPIEPPKPVQPAKGMNWSLSLAQMGDIKSEIDAKKASDIQAERVRSMSRQQEIMVKMQAVQKAYMVQEENGVKYLEEKDQLVRDINLLLAKETELSDKNTQLLDRNLRLYRIYYGLRISEAKLSGTYDPTSGKGRDKSLTPEQAEIRRTNLLNTAYGVQRNILNIEGKGVEVAAEKLEIEQQIALLKQLENKASADELRNILLQVQALKTKVKGLDVAIPREQRQVPFLERRFGKEKASAISEGLVGGAFPLLFGQGIGASVGGGLGGALGGMLGGGLGFGLSLAGTTIGGFLDQAVIKAKELGNLLLISSDNGNQLRQQGMLYTAELEKQVRLLKEQGQFAKASEIQRGAVTAQTGDIGTFNIKAAGAAANELEKAWKGFSSTFGNFFATAATPFVFVISVLLRGLQSALKVVNQITSGISWLINNIPGIGPMIQKFSEYASEQAIKGTEEYENQLSELNKQIAANEKNNKILTDKNNIIQGALGKSKVQFDLASKEAEARQRAAELEKQIQEFRASAPTGTSELRQKAAQQEAQMRFKFAQEERGILLSNAKEVFDAITQSNRAIAEQQKQYQREYADMVRQNARAQQDLDLEVARRVQDIRLEMREKELQYAKQVSDQELAAAKLLNEQRSFRRGISAAISGNPEDDIINTVQTAIENWRTGRKEVEQEYAAKQREIQLQAQKAEIAIQRYKFDNALKIARANEESQLKINRMQEQINKQNQEVIRNEFEARKAGAISVAKQRLASANADLTSATEMLKLQQYLTPEARMQYNASRNIALQDVAVFEKLLKDIETLFSGISITKLTPVGPPPRLTDPSAPVGAAMNDAALQSKLFAERIASLEKIQGLNQKDLELARALLDPGKEQLGQLNQIVSSQQKLNRETESYRQYIRSGMLPELAGELSKVVVETNDYIKVLQYLEKALMDLPEYNIPGSVVQQSVNRLSEMKKSAVLQARSAQGSIFQKYSPVETVTNTVDQLTGEITKLTNTTDLAIGSAQTIGEAFSASFKGIIDGSMTAQESLASFFQNISNYFLDMASQVISKMIQIQILNAVVGLLPGANMGGKNYFDPKTGLGVAGPNFGFALGGMFMNGIQPFARGGIVSSPTLFKFANGGAMRTGLMGEAGPEAIMPLTRGPGGRLGVDASGSGGGVNVTVNVDASGSKVQGDTGRAGELGRVVSAAVQQEIVKQKRPGGLLA